MEYLHDRGTRDDVPLDRIQTRLSRALSGLVRRRVDADADAAHAHPTTRSPRDGRFSRACSTVATQTVLTQEHVAGGVVEDVVGDRTAQDPLRTLHPHVADHDEDRRRPCCACSRITAAGLPSATAHVAVEPGRSDTWPPAASAVCSASTKPENVNESGPSCTVARPAPGVRRHDMELGTGHGCDLAGTGCRLGGGFGSVDPYDVCRHRVPVSERKLSCSAPHLGFARGTLDCRPRDVRPGRCIGGAARGGDVGTVAPRRRRS